MTLPRPRARLADALNFLVTNRIPRRLATRLVGWVGRIEHPLVARIAIGLWRLFGDIDLSDAETTAFPSMHACFTRRLRPGARPFAAGAGVLASPCDAIVGATGRVEGDQLLQVKGAAYSLAELLGDGREAARYRGGRYVTLRLTAGMYHRFHAPHELVVESVRYMAGDCWNVNPPALRRIERLFCRNERAALHARLPDGRPLALVAVAAILVAGIRLTILDGGLRALAGSSRDLAAAVGRGAELGWFEHGSTIVMLVPPGYEPLALLYPGCRVRAGQALFSQDCDVAISSPSSAVTIASPYPHPSMS